MGHAWPRYLPDATADATAHALLIEAYALLVEHLADTRGELIAAHDRAATYARARYTAEEVRAAWDACAAAPGNESNLLHHFVTLSATGAAIELQLDQGFRADLAA